MRPAVFGIGIVLTVIGLILMPLMYPLVMVDSPQDAGAKARADELAQGTPLRFKGKVKDVIENDLFTQKPAITIEGFEGSIGNIRVIVSSIDGIAVGDEMLVDGKFYGILGVGYVMGDYNEDTQKTDSAAIERVPTIGFFFALILFIAGLIIMVWGYRMV
jgi:hypothetical protein